MKVYIILIITILFAYCEMPDPHAGHGHDSHEGHGHGAEYPEGEVHITREQIETIGLELGGFTTQNMANYITATGVLDVPPNGVAAVHAPEIGFVRNLKKYINGSSIQKGQLIATLEHPMYIEKQQVFLEIHRELTYLSQEMERQKRLSEANAAALKNYQKIQSEYAVKEIKLKSVEQYLKYLGINTANLNSGNITQKINLVAPMSGIVTANNMRNGMLANSEIELMTILGNAHIHLELEVFESDIHKVKIGQNLSFKMASNPSESYKGKVYLIAPTFDEAKKTVHVHAHIIGKKPQFIKGAFVNAQIFENENAVAVLPESAVAIHEGNYYIFTEGKKTLFETIFHQIPVKVNQKNKGFWAVEPLKEINETAKIAIKGAFYLNAEMNKADHGHSH